MYTSLLCLLILMLIIGGSPDPSLDIYVVENSPTLPFLLGGLYFFILGLIALENRWLRKSSWWRWLDFLANVQLLLFSALFCLFLGGNRLISAIPYVGQNPLFIILFNLFLYFFGLYWHYLTKWGHYQHREAIKQIYFLIPFILPFLLLSIGEALFQRSPYSAYTNWLGMGILLILCVLFFPYFVTVLWKCNPLPATPLSVRLQSFCAKVNFKHAGMLNWSVLSSSYTAGVMGILPFCRYVVFTKSLLKTFTPDEIEAILAHEIGHSKHYHLVIYPFIFLGLAALMILYQYVISDRIVAWLFSDLSTSSMWLSAAPLLLLIPYIVIALVYFRFIFGYFSRLFERQADLTVLEFNMPVEPMVAALDRIGTLCGNIHQEPNWHHYGISERMEFLKKVERNPSLIAAHASWVRWSVGLYFLFLFALILFFKFYVLV